MKFVFFSRKESVFWIFILLDNEGDDSCCICGLENRIWMLLCFVRESSVLFNEVDWIEILLICCVWVFEFNVSVIYKVNVFVVFFGNVMVVFLVLYCVFF